MRRLAVMLLSLMCLGLAGCSNPSAGAGGVLRVGLAQMPMTLDPRYATDAASTRVQELVHRGLIKLDDHFQPEGDLAESWQHPEPLVWRFHLHAGIHFQDGSPLTAHDVAATLRAIMNPVLASPLRAGFAAIDHVEAQGDDVVLFLNKPDASLLTRLNLGILPAKLAGKPQQARQIIGCGPYRLQSWQGNTLTLSRVAAAGVPTIRFEGVKDPVTRVLKLVRGELDFTQNDLPPHLLSYLNRQKNLTVVTEPSTTFAYLGLNLQDEHLRDLRVRRALALAVDRTKLKRAMLGNLPILAGTVLTPSHWAAVKLPLTPFDPAEAERLLDAAGFPRGPDGIRFTLSFRTSTDPTRLDIATAIAAMWQRVGIAVKVESLEWGGFYARIKQGDFQVFSLSWVGITDPDIYRLILHSSMWPPKGANRGRYANPQVDHWLDEAAATSDQAQRKVLYARVEERMYADMVYIPLWFEPVISVTGSRISGFRPRPDGSLRGLQFVTLQ
ncbi:MAG TPA: ABC transporter substrate-binding protein [Mariprofundaceae bacterium]|nr:ABC transporter substrate-binding protein [Mariprofundaceae bacterium]